MSKIKLNAPTGGGSVSLEAPSSTTNDANVELKLPVADGSSGQVLKTDGSGNLSFGADTGGKILQFKKSIKLDTVSQAVNPGGSWSYSSGLSVTLTPSSASNSIVLLGQLTVGISAHEDLGVTIDQDGSELDSTRAAADGNRSRGTSVSGRFEDAGRALTFCIAMEVSAGNTNQRSYNYRIRHGGGVQRTLYINRSGSDTNGVYYFRGASSLLAFEVAP
tara:strand:+ start:678 stop:1334 length:657 start_codon:yes stop_codon:yes gene_type:complete